MCKRRDPAAESAIDDEIVIMIDNDRVKKIYHVIIIWRVRQADTFLLISKCVELSRSSIGASGAYTFCDWSDKDSHSLLLLRFDSRDVNGTPLNVDFLINET